jgi:hypothetical protein
MDNGSRAAARIDHPAEHQHKLPKQSMKSWAANYRWHGGIRM